MAASAQDRALIESQKMMGVYQPAIDQTLDAMDELSPIRHWGYAHVSNCESYYIITLRGIHYCEQEKTGFLKKQYVPRFFSLDPVESLDVDERGPNAYLRFMGGGKMLLSMWFTDETCEGFFGKNAWDKMMEFANDYST